LWDRKEGGKLFRVEEKVAVPCGAEMKELNLCVVLRKVVDLFGSYWKDANLYEVERKVVDLCGVER
jgi:hypothetical protein